MHEFLYPTADSKLWSRDQDCFHITVIVTIDINENLLL
jgi:hypothetical protein